MFDITQIKAGRRWKRSMERLAEIDVAPFGMLLVFEQHGQAEAVTTRSVSEACLEMG